MYIVASVWWAAVRMSPTLSILKGFEVYYSNEAVYMYSTAVYIEIWYGLLLLQ